MSEIDAIISGLNRFSLVAQLRDKVSDAFDAQRDRCGDCGFWMKSRSCPREHNVNGMSRGPDAGAIVCPKFQIEQRAINRRARLIREAVDFAQMHDLPLPSFPAAKEDARHG